MSLVLIAIVLAIGAGAVVAVSTREPAAAAIGIAVALVAAALVAQPLPSAAILGVRVVAALLVATLIRWATVGGRRRPSPLGWPSEALLATAGAVAGLGLSVGLATIAPAGALPYGPESGPTDVEMPAVITNMALTVAAGCSLLALGLAPFIHGPMGGRRAIGLVLVAQAVLLIRVGIAGPGVAIEEVASAALLVVCGATGAVLARAAAPGHPPGDADPSLPESARPAAAR